MNSPEENDPLDALLREQNTYLEDAGFTKRVIAALPRRRASRVPRFFLLGAAIVGWIIAAVWMPWGNLPALDASAVSSFNSQLLLPWIVMLSIIGSLIWTMLAAIQWED